MSLMIDIRKLRLFNEMAKQGGETVADHLREMTGLDAEMEITRINFLDVADVKAHVGDEERIGIAVGLVEPPHGHILFLVDAASAKTLAGRMVGDIDAAGGGSGFTEMERSAIQEIGNIMTSGFIDGWANVLETTIDISTPKFASSSGSEMVDGLLGSSPDEMALVFDSRIHVPEADVDLTVYLFPDLEELVALMGELEV